GGDDDRLALARLRVPELILLAGDEAAVLASVPALVVAAAGQHLALRLRLLGASAGRLARPRGGRGRGAGLRQRRQGEQGRQRERAGDVHGRSSALQDETCATNGAPPGRSGRPLFNARLPPPRSPECAVFFLPPSFAVLRRPPRAPTFPRPCCS